MECDRCVLFFFVHCVKNQFRIFRIVFSFILPHTESKNDFRTMKMKYAAGIQETNGSSKWL